MGNVNFLDTPLAKADQRRTQAGMRSQLSRQGETIKRLRIKAGLLTILLAGSGAINIILIWIAVYLT